MRSLQAAWRRLGGLFGRERGDREVKDEIESNLQMHIDDNVRAGMTAEEARRSALVKLGGIEPAVEAYRDQRGIPAIETLLQDLRYAGRTLRKAPGFAAVVVLTLALGTGANTAMFSLIDAVLLKLLPVPHPEQLVFVNTQSTQVGNIGVSRSILRRDLEQMQARAKRVAGLGNYVPASRLNVAMDGRAELASGHFVGGRYFDALGLVPFLGRAIQASDDRAAGRVAMLGYGYWQRRFGGDAGVLGKLITVSNVPFTIIGVAPPEFYGLSTDSPADVLLPMATMPQVSAGGASAQEPKPDDYAGYVFARLKEGVRPSDAAAELAAILRQTEREALGAKPDGGQFGLVDKLSIVLQPASQGLSSVRNRFSKPLEVLMVVVGLVMLIACANIANLLLAKSSARQREIGIRLSLGSSRRRLIRQLMTESLVLSVLGAVLGVLFAVWLRSAIVYLATPEQGGPTIPDTWNVRVFAFTAGISIFNAFLFGLAPALRATGVDLAAMLKNVRTGRTAGRITLGKVLVAGQVAVSLTLLVGAALFLNTFRNLDRIDVGFERKHLLMATLDPSMSGHHGAQAEQIFKRAMEGIERIPGVQAATLMRDRILNNYVSLTSIWVPGYTLKSNENAANQWVVSNSVGPRFFAISGIRLVAGRDFSDRDNERAPKVAIVNQSMARHYFAGQSPIGRQIAWSRTEPPVEIIGVLRDIAYLGVRDRQQDVVFTPILQSDPESWNSATVLMRTSVDPARVLGGVRSVIRGIDPNLPAYAVMTMERQVENTLVQQELLATLSTFFAVLALGLSAVGLYGVLSYGVAQRTSEIGLRMALGAPRGSILRLLLGETAWLLAIGLALGAGAALAASRFIASMLYGVTASDATPLLGAAAILSAVALLAGFLPARRASRVDPMAALHYE